MKFWIAENPLSGDKFTIETDDISETKADIREAVVFKRERKSKWKVLVLNMKSSGAGISDLIWSGPFEKDLETPVDEGAPEIDVLDEGIDVLEDLETPMDEGSPETDVSNSDIDVLEEQEPIGIGIPKVRVWKRKRHSAETRAKMKIARNKRPPASDETRKKMSESHKGKVFTEEHKRNLSWSHKHQKDVVVTIASLTNEAAQTRMEQPAGYKPREDKDKDKDKRKPDCMTKEEAENAGIEDPVC